MNKVLFSIALCILLLSGCSTIASREAPAPPKMTPYDIGLNFSSEIPEYYYVLRVPIESYGRYRVNDLFRSRLSEHLDQKKQRSSDKVAQLFVRLVDVSTDFRRYGQRPALPEAPKVILASAAGLIMPGRLRSDLDNGPTPGNIPDKIVKTVRMTAEVELRISDQVLRQEALTEEVIEIIDFYWDDWDETWSFDYGRVIAATITKMIASIDRILDEELLGS